MRQLLILGVLIAGSSACRSSAKDDSIEHSEALISPAQPELAQPTPAGATIASAHAIGRLDDRKIEQLLYEALMRRVNGAVQLTGGMTESRELGERATFEFSIIKAVRDGIEVEGNEVPDSLDIEVRGWYRRRRSQQQTDDSQPMCTSFDTVATVVYREDRWKLGENQNFAFTREDEEDCY